MFPSKLSQSLVASIVALACVIAVRALQLPQLNQLKSAAATASQEAFHQEVEAERLRLNLLKKAPALGFDNLLANWIFLGFLQYFGDDPARQVTGYELSPAYFDILVERDPLFLEAYTGLSTSISLYAARPDKSVELMSKGLQSMSPKAPLRSYYVWRYKAIDELLFFGDAQASSQSFDKAAEWASVYSDEEGKNMAALSRKTAKFLASNPNSIKPVQEVVWMGVLTNAANTDDRRTLKTAISRIEALGGKVSKTPEGNWKVVLPNKS